MHDIMQIICEAIIGLGAGVDLCQGFFSASIKPDAAPIHILLIVLPVG